jgi:hypothetical protein
LQCGDLAATSDVQTYQVRGSGEIELHLDFVFREASYNNELAFFRVDEPSGSIDGLGPGDAGYLAAAFARAVIVFAAGSDASTPDVSLRLNGGDILAFFIVQADTLVNLMLGNPYNDRNRTPRAFFSLDALNPDGVDHFVGFVNGSVSHFGFEDQTDGGDEDYDDVVYNVIPPLIPNGLCTTDAACDDGNACTDDACTTGGVCQYTCNAGECDDGDARTTSDRCTACNCIGRMPPICGDGIVASPEECEPSLGGCTTGSCTPTCTCSAPATRPAVLFLHGTMGSYLYAVGLLSRDQLWPPNQPTGGDLDQLQLTETGDHRIPVFAGREEIIEEVPITGENVYESLVEFFTDGAAEGGWLGAWYAYAYDWRLDLQRIVDDGTYYSSACLPSDPNGQLRPGCDNPFCACVRLDEEVEALANRVGSASHSVWIVTHSNGGLLAKTLLQRRPDLREKIAGLIMLVPPQLGTPRALAPALHGAEYDIGLVAPKSNLRSTARTLPGLYHLLPHTAYFARNAGDLAVPAVAFQTTGKRGVTHPPLSDWARRYGSSISDYASLRKFLSDPERAAPEAGDVDEPAVLLDGLLESAAMRHEDMTRLDPVALNFPVYQVVGVGIDTVAGLTYYPVRKWFSPSGSSDLRFRYERRCAGDGTVIISSADVLQVPTFYVDLPAHNRGRIVARDHSSIGEIDEVRTLIRRLMSGESPTERLNGLTYVKSDPPDLSRCEFSSIVTHSPAEVHVYQGGLHTGPVSPPGSTGIPVVERQIPNSQHHGLGSGWEVVVDTVGTYDAVVRGTDTGSLGIELFRRVGSNVERTIEYAAIPVTAGSIVRFQLDPALTRPPAVQIDVDGDGIDEAVMFDASLSAQLRAALASLRRLVVRAVPVATVRTRLTRDVTRVQQRATAALAADVTGNVARERRSWKQAKARLKRISRFLRSTKVRKRLPQPTRAGLTDAVGGVFELVVEGAGRGATTR